MKKQSNNKTVSSEKSEARRKQPATSTRTKTVLLFVFLVLFRFSGTSQNIGINTTGTAPNASAMLDVDATNKGILIPRVSLTSPTDVTTIATPATSLLVYNTNQSMTNSNGTGYYYWGGAKWTPVDMTSSSGGPCALSMVTDELIAINGAPCTGASCTGASMSGRNCSIACDNLSYNGFSDWRMPSINDEVRSSDIICTNLGRANI